MAISSLGGPSTSTTGVSAPKWTIPGNAFTGTSTGSAQADNAFVSTTTVTAGAYLRWHLEAIVTASSGTPFATQFNFTGTAVPSGFSSFATFSGDTIDTSNAQPFPMGVNNAGVINNSPSGVISGTPPTLAAGLSGLLILDMDFPITTGGTFSIIPLWGASSGVSITVKRRAYLQLL